MSESAMSELRHGSIAGSDIIRPEPADPEDVSKKARSRRARLPRSQSASNMLEAVGASNRTVKYEPRDVPRESNEHRNLRDLAKFFRTTAPPVHNAHDNCMTLARSGSSGSGDNSKLSIQSMMKRRRAAKRGTQSLQLQLSDKVIAKKTIEGYPYAAFAIPNQQDVDGPWFRSQYPVIPRSNSRGPQRPPEWSERTTSRGVLSPSSPTHAISTDDLRSKSHSSHYSLDLKSQSHGPSPDDLKNFTEARLQAASFLRRLAEDSLNVENLEAIPPTDTTQPLEGIVTTDQQLQPSPLIPPLSTNDKYGSSVTAMEYPATPPPSGKFQDFQWPEVVVNSVGTSPTASPKTLLSRRRQRSVSNLQTGHSSPKSRGPPQTGLNIGTDSILAVPEDNVQPESPGFPKMLAAMEFPSPPRVSRSPSLASTPSSGFPSPPSAQPTPVIRPRTSSKNAMTTPNGPVSLNEIIMQPTRPGLLHSQSDYALRDSADRDLVDRGVPVITGLGITTTSGAACEISRRVEPATFADDTVPIQLDTSAPTAIREEDNCIPSASAAVNDNTSYRQSASSVSSDVTDSHRYSTSPTANRQSTRSNATTVSTAPTLAASETTIKSQRAVISSPQPTNDPVLDTFSRSRSHSTLQAATTLDNTSAKPLSIAERRLAREGRSADSRERSIDLTRSGHRPLLRAVNSSESIDSPVLGWFSQNMVPTRKASLHGPSPLARMSQTVAFGGSSEDHMRAEDFTSRMSSAVEKDQSVQDYSQKPVENSSRAVDVANSTNPRKDAWSISRVLAAEIEPKPEAAPIGRRQQNLAISPLMVVADIEPNDVSEAVSDQGGSLRLSGVFTTENAAPPFLPSKSPRRPRYTPKRLSRHIPLPVKVAIDSSETIVPAMPGKAQILGRSSLPTFPTTIQSKALKRLSLPIHVSGSQPAWTSRDRTSITRRRETWMPQQLEEESSLDELETSPTEALPRRRSSVIKERIKKEKMAKEKEIADLVANITVTAPKVEVQPVTADDNEQSKDDTTDDLELRLQLLEQNSDAWLSVLDPLLSNMTSTLREMKKDGKGAPLLMGEFMIDMAAEARRSMLSIKSPERLASMRNPVTFPDFDGAHPASKPKTQPTPGLGVNESIRIRKSGEGRRSPNTARLRLPLEQPEQPEEPQEKQVQESKQPVKEDFEESKEIPEAEIDSPVVQTLVVPERASSDGPRTPQQHEFEAQMAVKKRIQAQEVMMDKLMSKWGMPTPRTSQESTKIEITEARPEVAEYLAEHKTHSRGSSVDTVKPAAGGHSESNPPDSTLLNLKNEPLSNIRRGSRRWSSAGERASWKPSDNGFMTGLIQDLRESSRISLESTGDVQSFL